MIIYKQIFVIFSILIVELTCNIISKDEEETKLDTPKKKSLEPEIRYQKESTNNKISEPEYFSQDCVIKEVWDTTNMKHQSRNLKGYRTKGNENHESFYSENRKTNSPKNEDEKNFDLDSKILIKIMKKLKSKSKQNLQYNLKNFVRREISIKILEANKEKLSAPMFPSIEDFQIILDMDIHPLHLVKSMNQEMIQFLYHIHEELIALIELDIQSNVLPLVFYQTVSPVIKKKLIPFLKIKTLKGKFERFEKDLRFPWLFTILRDLLDVPQDLKFDYTISNMFRMIDQDFKGRRAFDSDTNKNLAKLYKNIVKLIQKILKQDWKENEAPVNFIKFVVAYFQTETENLYFIGRLITQALTEKLIRNDFWNVRIIERFLKSLESLL